MLVTGWSCGSVNPLTGAGYGVRISKSDRHHFKREWPLVAVELEGAGSIVVNLSDSFWRNCCELRSAAIGKWMIRRKLAPWPPRQPPRMVLSPVGERRFRLSCTEDRTSRG